MSFILPSPAFPSTSDSDLPEFPASEPSRSPSDGLGRVAFFGRTLADYEDFFGLSIADLRADRVLDVGGGTASFTAEFVAAGGEAVAVDPVYRLRLPAVRVRARQDFEANRKLLRNHPGRFTLAGVDEVEALLARRQVAQDRFLADFVAGCAAGRYRGDALPRLGFADKSFDRVFCGHFLFLYGEYFSFSFHLAAIREMLRLARREVRIYPLQTMRNEAYADLDRILDELPGTVAVRRQPVRSGVLREARECLVLSHF
jgi:SAM-dependent methyltransferase